MGETLIDRSTVNFASQLTMARRYLSRGELDRAESKYRNILARDSENGDAYHGLGLIAYQTENFTHAIDLIRHALVHQPDDIEAMNNLGTALNAAGRYQEAEVVISEAIQRRPDYPEAINNLGSTLRRLKRRKEAIDVFKRGVKFAANFKLLRMNYARVLIEVRQFDEAISFLNQHLEQESQDLETHFMVGLAHAYANNFEAARDCFTICIQLEPYDVESHFRRGHAQAECGERINAQVSYKLVLELDPDHVAACNNLANIYTTVGRYDEAVELYQRGLALMPGRADVMDNLGTTLRKASRFDEAFEVLEEALGLHPNHGSLYNDLGAAHQSVGEMEKAAAAYLKAVELDPHESCAEKNYLFAVVNMPNLSSEERFRCHREVRKRHTKPEALAEEFPDRSRDPERRLRIGYVSADFRTHVVSLNTMTLFDRHNHDQFEIFGYAQLQSEDHVTKQFKSVCDHWQLTARMNDAELAEKIGQDEIDILICMAGRFDDNRPLIASYRAAPIQVTFHDVATSGLDSMDYWFTDSVLHPPDTEELSTEELYHLPVYYQYPVQENLPDIGCPPNKTNGYITFGSFNKPEKLNDEVIALWSRILKEVPDSKLFLKYFNHFREHSLRSRLMKNFEAHGIAGERIIHKAKNDSHYSHLELYQEMDIALDPFPFNGATTTFEAMSMGVPVVTLQGRDFVARVATSMLTHVGHPELIARSNVEYVKLATNLATDSDRLNTFRRILRTDLENSPLIDGERYTGTIEAAYRDMWRRWCKGIPIKRPVDLSTA